MNEPSDSETVKPSRRLKFSIRTMLIVVAVVAILTAGTRWLILSNTFYQLDAFVVLKQGEPKKLKQAANYADLIRRIRFYQGDVNTPHNLPYDESAIWYKSIPNYFEVDQKAFKLRQQLVATVEQSPELQFDRYKIRNLTTGETIEEGDIDDLRMSIKNKK